MTTTPMPAEVSCCRCKNIFPVKAVMSLSGGNIPLLVVLGEVTSVEVAITMATCQVCLKKEGPKDRGLHSVLMALGCIEATTPSAPLSVPSRLQPSAPTLDISALIKARGRERGPTMAGVRVVMPPPLPRGNLRAPPREERLDDHPRLPKVLEKPVVHEPEPKAELLRVSLDERSMAALKAAGVQAAQRDEKKKYSRLGKFGARMKKLKHLLTFVREHAVHADVDAHVEKFYVIYTEALAFDPKQRSKKVLLERLGTSETQLEMLRVQFWFTHTIVPKKGGGDGGQGEGEDLYEVRLHEPRSLVTGIKLEEVEENPFPDGRRPRHFDKQGEGRQATLRPVIVVRAKSDLPRVANKPLGEPEDPCPKIVYPEGGRYGKVFTVQGSRRVSPKDRTWGRAQGALLLWAADHPESAVPLDLLCSYLEPFLDEPSEIVNESDDALSQEETQPHAEV